MKQIFLVLVLLIALKENVPAQGGQGWAQGFPTNSVQEGDTATLYPFRGGFTRFQQVYASTGFVNTGPSGVYIQEIGFRLDSLLGFSRSGFSTNVQINLSTTAQPVDGLSSVFSENVGVDDIIVFGPRTTRFAVGYVPGGVQGFDILFQFDQPFLYDPAAGNLLFDFRIHGGSTFGNWFDARPQPDDAVSSVMGNVTDFFGTVSTIGLPTAFFGTVVPEPSSSALFALGTAAFLLMKRKPKP